MTEPPFPEDGDIDALRRENATLRERLAVLEQELAASRQREHAAHMRERHIRTLLEGDIDGFFEWNITEGTVAYSQNWLCSLGYQQGELDNQANSIEYLLHPDDRARVEQVLLSHLQGHTPFYQCEHRLLRKDGSWKWVLDRGKVVEWNDDATPRLMIGVHTDVTAFKELEAALEDERRRLFTLLDELPAFVYLQAPDYSIRFANRYFREHFGEPAHQPCYEVLHQRHTSCDICPTFRVFEPPHEYQEWESTTTNGRVYHIYDYPFTDTDGSLLVLELGIDVTERKQAEDALRAAHSEMEQRILERTSRLSEMNDALYAEITERKRAEEALRQNQALLHAIIENLPAAVYVKDMHGQPVLVNHYYASLVHLDPQQILKKTVSGLYPSKFAATWDTSDQQALATGRPVEIEQVIPQEDGLHTYLTIKFLVFDAEESVYAIGSISTDITRRKLTEEALRESEARYRAIVEDQTDMICRYRPDGTLTFVNEAYCRYFGRSYEQLIRRNFMAFVPPEEHERIRAYLASFTTSRPVSTMTHRVIDQTGALRWHQWTDRAIFNDRNELVEFQSVGHDVTDRTRAEEALHQSELRYRSIVEQSSDGILLADEQGVLVEWNSATERITGMERSAAIGRPVWEVIYQLSHPRKQTADYAYQLEQSYQRFFATGDAPWLNQLVEHILQRPDGSTCYMQQVSFPIQTNKGTMMCNMSRDITERVQAEEELRTREEELRTLYRAVEQSPSSIVITDVNGNIEYVNPRFTRITGYTFDEVYGQNPRLLQSGQTDPTHYQTLWATITSGNEWHGEFLNKKKHGELFWEFASISPVFNTEGVITHFVAVKEDVTERKHTMESLHRERALLAQHVEERTAELSAANAELARAARFKDEFLASISHELRTPLNAILGLSEAASKGVYGSVSESLTETLVMIDESGRRLLALINDILDLSKIEAGKLKLNLNDCVISRMCESVIQSFLAEIQQKHLQVSLEIDPQVTVTNAVADERRLKQILGNLISNAVKFTPAHGSVGLSVRHDLPHALSFVVWDTGIGIAADDMPRLFRPFVQLDSGLTRRYTGLGLGLTLVYRLIELHGGSVAVQSSSGQGSRFTVQLPIRMHRTGPDAPAPTTMQQGRTRTIVVAEDSEHMLAMLLDTLTAWGYRVIGVRNGVEAIERTREHRPSLLLVNLNMPVMDGWETIRRIRADSELSTIPMVATTARVIPGDRERCLATGALEYLVKPLNTEELYHTIEQICAAYS